MELYLPPTRPQRNRITGRYLPGCRPWNKGKNWDDYLSEQAQKRCRQNLKLNGNKYGTHNKIPVVAMLPNGQIVGSFNSISEAAAKTNVHYSNIIWCLQGKRKSSAGFLWRKKNLPSR